MATSRWGGLSLLLLFLLSACVSRERVCGPDSAGQKARALERMLRALPGADPVEARYLARTAIGVSLELRRRYGVSTPPLWHNTLVNLGIRKRGLCWHWADDLYRRLTALRLRTFRIVPVGANVGKYWSEHSALAVLPTDGGGFPLDEGVLLDPWRGGGRLFFTRVGADPAYRWSVRRDRMKATDLQD